MKHSIIINNNKIFMRAIRLNDVLTALKVESG